MKRFTWMIMSAAFALSTGSVMAQSKHVPHKCASVEVMEQEMIKHPELVQERAEYEKSIQQYLLHNKGQAKSGGKRIIPVVFHVIHECGPENISRAQILDQIRVMNEDYSLTNPNFSQTPAAFVPLAADCQIEFRLATKDDLGNCTDGIVRVYSPKTNEANNDNGVKSVSHWNSYKYLNVWVVKSIGDVQGTGGEVLGYAQFPMGGLMSTDGIVIRHDCIGSIGTAANGSFGPRLGRTVTHEVGHWLGLRHIWGDADCGSDGVDTTPIAFGPNYGICWSDYPYNLTSCGRDTADTSGEMFNNYMDYSDDQCMSMFTKGIDKIDTNYLDTTSSIDITNSNPYLNDTIYSLDTTSIDTISNLVYQYDTVYTDSVVTSTFTVDSVVVDSVFEYEYVYQGDTLVIDSIATLLYVTQTIYQVDSIATDTYQVIDSILEIPTFVDSYVYNTEWIFDSVQYIYYELITSRKSGQLDIIDGTLATIRAYIHSEANLEATGTRDEDVANPVTCAPIASFCDNRRMVCAGATVTYTDESYNTQSYSTNWEFEGGTPATSTASAPVVTYANSGVYNVKLTVTNPQGENSVQKNDHVTISTNSAEFSTGPFWDNLDYQTNIDRWIIYNNDNTINKWEFSPWTGFGTFGSCVKMRNFQNTPTETDDFISPSYNLATISNPSMTFRISGAERNGTADDALKIYTSTNCGQTWILRKTISGAELITAGLYTTEFVPTNTNQWQTFALGLTSVATQTNVRFRFEFVAGINGSNNLYLDDINIGTALSIEDPSELIGLSAYPNPTNGTTRIEFNTATSSKVQIRLMDMLGKQVLVPFTGQVGSGLQNFNIDLSNLAGGLYTIQLDIDGQVYHKKIMKN